MSYVMLTLSLISHQERRMGVSSGCHLVTATHLIFSGGVKEWMVFLWDVACQLRTLFESFRDVVSVPKFEWFPVAYLSEVVLCRDGGRLQLILSHVVLVG